MTQGKGPFMGAVTLRGLKVVGNWYSSGGMEQYVNTQYKNKSGQVFKAGELVAVDATPEILRVTSIVGGGDDRLDVSALDSLYAGTTPNIIETMTLATSLLRIFGIALIDAPASGQVNIPVAMIIPGTLVEGNLVTATAGDGDAPASLALTAAHLSSPVALVFDDTADRWYFTPTIVTTSERAADIQKIALGVGGGGTQDAYGAIGDTNARVQATLRMSVLRACLPTTGTGTT
jgi:hypothetical protein